MRFQVHCPPLVGVLPIFRSRYFFAIGRQVVLSLGRWASRIRSGFHVSGPTQVPGCALPPTPTGLSPSSAALSRAFGWVPHASCLVLQPPGGMPPGFGLVRFRSPLLTESRFLSLPPGTEMFQFPGFATPTYGFSRRPFGNPGINACLTATPGFSQSSAPFFASWRLDIPRTPLLAWPHWSRPPAPGWELLASRASRPRPLLAPLPAPG
jgi:hypothetical protein